MWTDFSEPADLESLTSAEPPFAVETPLPALSEEVNFPLPETAFPEGEVLIFFKIYLHHLHCLQTQVQRVKYKA